MKRKRLTTFVIIVAFVITAGIAITFLGKRTAIFRGVFEAPPTLNVVVETEPVTELNAETGEEIEAIKLRFFPTGGDMILRNIRLTVHTNPPTALAEQLFSNATIQLEDNTPNPTTSIFGNAIVWYNVDLLLPNNTASIVTVHTTLKPDAAVGTQMRFRIPVAGDIQARLAATAGAVTPTGEFPLGNSTFTIIAPTPETETRLRIDTKNTPLASTISRGETKSIFAFNLQAEDGAVDVNSLKITLLSNPTDSRTFVDRGKLTLRDGSAIFAEYEAPPNAENQLIFSDSSGAPLIDELAPSRTITAVLTVTIKSDAPAGSEIHAGFPRIDHIDTTASSIIFPPPPVGQNFTITETSSGTLPTLRIADISPTTDSPPLAPGTNNTVALKLRAQAENADINIKKLVFAINATVPVNQLFDSLNLTLPDGTGGTRSLLIDRTALSAENTSTLNLGPADPAAVFTTIPADGTSKEILLTFNLAATAPHAEFSFQTSGIEMEPAGAAVSGIALPINSRTFSALGVIREVIPTLRFTLADDNPSASPILKGAHDVPLLIFQAEATGVPARINELRFSINPEIRAALSDVKLKTTDDRRTYTATIPTGADEQVIFSSLVWRVPADSTQHEATVEITLKNDAAIGTEIFFRLPKTGIVTDADTIEGGTTILDSNLFTVAAEIDDGADGDDDTPGGDSTCPRDMTLVSGVCQCLDGARYFPGTLSETFYGTPCMPCTIAQIIANDGIHCPADTPPAGPRCGNNTCELGETLTACPIDCHAIIPTVTCEQLNLFTYTGSPDPAIGLISGMCIPCSQTVWKATNGTCIQIFDPNANRHNAAGYVCGDNMCEAPEDSFVCPNDCVIPNEEIIDLPVDTGLPDETEPPVTAPYIPPTNVISTVIEPQPSLAGAPRLAAAPDKSETGPGALMYAIYGATLISTYATARFLRARGSNIKK